MGKQTTRRSVGLGVQLPSCLLALRLPLLRAPLLVFPLSRPYPHMASLLIQTYLTVLTKTFWVYYLSRLATGSAL